MTQILVTTSLVSIDAIFIGMSLGVQKNHRIRFLFSIFSIIFLSSLLAFFISTSIRELINFDTSLLIAFAFIILGLEKLFAKVKSVDKLTYGFTIILGMVMSIDAVVTTVALTIEQSHSIVIPITVAVGHLAFLFAGSFLTRYIKTSHKAHRVISASCLFFVAILNFIGLI